VIARRRYFFVHIQKTAGTALWRRLKHQFEPQALYPGPDDGDAVESVLSIDHLQARWQVRQDEIRVLTGHFPLCTTELLGERFFTFTVLREPVERTLSALRDLQQRSPELQGEPLDLILRDQLRAPLLHNHMVRMLGFSVEDMTAGALTPGEVTGGHLERAVDRLSTIDVIGLQERFEEFCTDLSSRFGWDLGPPVFMNRTTAVPVSAELRERVAETNALDLELYREAVQRCDDRR
jgi:hypothetical protein